MFSDEPFVPEKVEKQIADLIENLHGNKTQQQTHNLRLVNDLQQLYYAYQADQKAVEQARRHLLLRLDERTSQSAGLSSLPYIPMTNPQNERRVMPQKQGNIWRLALVAALLLIGVFIAGTVIFTRSTLHSSTATVHETTPHQAVSNGSGALGTAIEPQPYLCQNTLYINTGQDIRSYAAQNGTPERTYALADTGNPTIVDGILYTGGLKSTSALRISDGKLLWQYRLLKAPRAQA